MPGFCKGGREEKLDLQQVEELGLTNAKRGPDAARRGCRGAVPADSDTDPFVKGRRASLALSVQ